MAVSFDAIGDAHTGTPAGNNDFASFMTVGATADALVVGVCTSNQSAVPTVTWDQGGTNQSMTSIGTANATGGTGKVTLFGLLTPTVGLKTLRVAIAGTADEVFAGGVSFIGVRQTGGAASFAHFATNSGNSATSTIVNTSQTGNMTVDLSSGPQVMASPTQTQIFANNSGSVTSAAMSRGAGAGSVTHSWTFGDGTPGSAVQWVAIGVDVMAADAGDPAPSIGSSGVISRQFDGKCRPRQFAPGLAR